MLSLAIVWFIVGLVLWVGYKVTDNDSDDALNNPPQSTFSGAMLWPFYLLGYLWDQFATAIGIRPRKIDEE